jgi:uncharacterized phage-like protein YoqJ
MKKIFLLLTVFSMVFTSCEPLEDINAEVDAILKPIVGDAEYTLTADDYEAFGLNYGSFNSEDEVKSTIPPFLAEMFPVWGKNSSVLLNYQLYIGNAEGIINYTNSEDYSLALADYPGNIDNAVAFYESENPVTFIPDILSEKTTNPEEGQITLVKYKQYVGETVNGITEFYIRDFAGEGTLLDYKAVSVNGDQVWEGSNYGAKMTGFASGNRNPNEDWLISSDIDLSSFPNATLQTTQIFNYGDPSGFSVLISTDYTDDILAATWDVIELTNVPDGTSWDEVLSDAYSLSDYNGETINIAFKYISTDSDAGTYEIVDVSLKAPGVEGVAEPSSEFYTFDGSSWELSEGVYYLSDDDFDSMGEGSGQPGKYNNFSSSISPDDYLLTFLSKKYPYALEGDDLSVIYRYYSSNSGAQLRGNLYTFMNGAWSSFQSTISTSLQFGHDGNNWEPDNTIKYTLVRNADYEYMASQLTTDEYSGLIGNLAKYGDFDYNWTDAQINYALAIFLDYLNPNAEEGQKYILTYVIYDNGENDYKTAFIKTGGAWVVND